MIDLTVTGPYLKAIVVDELHAPEDSIINFVPKADFDGNVYLTNRVTFCLLIPKRFLGMLYLNYKCLRNKANCMNTEQIP